MIRIKEQNIVRGLIALSLCLMVSGCSTLKYYPQGVGSFGAVPYLHSPVPYKCSRCGEDTHLYKVDSKNRVVCNRCFMKLK